MKTIFIWGFLILCGASIGFAEQVTAPPTAQAIDVGNTACPVSGKAVNPKATTVYQGKRYAFCCKHCAAEFNKDPEKFLAKLSKNK